MHPVKDAPVHRLQAVAGVRQGPAHDGRERVGEIALLECVAEVDLFSASGRRRRRDVFSHDWTRSEALRPNQVPFLFCGQLCTELRFDLLLREARTFSGVAR